MTNKTTGKPRTTESGPIPTKEKRARKRSPNYPILSLEDAIERAGVLYKQDGVHYMRIQLSHERWGYKPFSSIADQTTAALRAYGLLDVEGEGQQRRVRVSQVAERIIDSAPDRDDLIREAALRPAIHKELWDKYGQSGLPSDENIQSYLKWDRPGGTFNKDVVEGVTGRFRQTIAFANLRDGDIIEGRVEPDEWGDGGDNMTNPPPSRDRKPPPGTRGQVMDTTQAIPLPVLFDDGVIKIVSIPKMTSKAFEFFKTLLDTYKAAIVADPPSGDQTQEE